MNVEIVSWSPRYEAWLRTAIGAFMDAGVARGGDLLNTPRNVEVYLNIGLKGAAAGDPCLLALVDGLPVAYVMWVGVPNVLDARWKSLNAIGSYTEPAFRSRTIAHALREAALRISHERNYERVVGPVASCNYRGVREFCETYGAWPMGINFELAL